MGKALDVPCLSKPFYVGGCLTPGASATAWHSKDQSSHAAWLAAPYSGAPLLPAQCHWHCPLTVAGYWVMYQVYTSLMLTSLHTPTPSGPQGAATVCICPPPLLPARTKCTHEPTSPSCCTCLLGSTSSTCCHRCAGRPVGQPHTAIQPGVPASAAVQCDKARVQCTRAHHSRSGHGRMMATILAE